MYTIQNGHLGTLQVMKGHAHIATFANNKDSFAHQYLQFLNAMYELQTNFINEQAEKQYQMFEDE